MHVYPLLDVQHHVMSEKCWCKPTFDDEDGRMWVHHAADGREDTLAPPNEVMH